MRLFIDFVSLGITIRAHKRRCVLDNKDEADRVKCHDIDEIVKWASQQVENVRRLGHYANEQ